uniref:Bro-N domain-containing protein n=1 Tax=Heliothis armigera entomopoxvirus TaxID=10290 RepID=O89462_HAEPV|nr:orf6 [Heliothis armigera entomopoxvirus]
MKSFKYKNINIDVLGDINYPWFNGKNILIDGLQYTEQSAKCVLKRLESKFKNKLSDIICVGGNLPPTGNLDKISNITRHNDGKAIYINEAGLYYIIIHCTKESAKPFQDYILFDLLPSIRKLAQKKYLDIINNKQDKIDILTQDLEEIKNQNILTIEQNNKLLQQNQLALNKLQELGINLIESKEEIKSINNRIDTIIVDRNIKPSNPKLHHKYLLLKNKNKNEYKFIRAQDKYIKNNKSLWLEKYNTIIEEKYNPNPIDLCSRLKDKIAKLNPQESKKLDKIIKN